MKQFIVRRPGKRRQTHSSGCKRARGLTVAKAFIIQQKGQGISAVSAVGKGAGGRRRWGAGGTGEGLHPKADLLLENNCSFVCIYFKGQRVSIEVSLRGNAATRRKKVRLRTKLFRRQVPA